MSSQVGNVAANRVGNAGGDRLPRHSSLNGVVKFVGSGRWPGAAEGFVPVVDPSVIDQPVSSIENCNFRRHLYLAQLYQFVMRITQSRKPISKVVQIFANTGSRCF